MPSIAGWFRPSLAVDRLVCRSQAYVLAEHFVDERGRSARCPGDGCKLCGLYPLRRSLAFAVSRPGSPRVWLLRIPSAAMRDMPALFDLGPALIGKVIAVSRLSSTASEGLEVSIEGDAPTTAVACRNYVAAIGRKEYDRCVGSLVLELHDQTRQA